MSGIRPLPCFVCGELPKVEDFALMVSYKRGWTALCPNHHYETDAYYDREGAIEAWNRWCDTEGYVNDDDGDECEDDEWTDDMW
jgi:hypothetical protein